MNILIIEDNLLKREKICEFLSGIADIRLSEEASYNSGLVTAQSGSFDLIVLDMSMPTFDRSDETHGGRFRSLGGRQIARKLAKAGKLVPFVVVTGYKDFSESSGNKSIAEIDESLRELGSSYLGYIIFDAAESLWKENLLKIVESLN